MQPETEVEIPAKGVFEGLHIKRDFLERYVRDSISLDPEDRLAMNNHFRICPGKKCQEVINEIVKADEKEDWKLSQMPEGDR